MQELERKCPVEKHFERQMLSGEEFLVCQCEQLRTAHQSEALIDISEHLFYFTSQIELVV